MNNQEALKYIEEENNEQLQKIIETLPVDDNCNSTTKFESTLIKLIIPYKWAQQHPEHFLNCYVTEKLEYDSNKCSGYSWFMECINAHFDFDKYYLSSFNFVYDKENTTIKAKTLLEEALMTNDIISWCVNHLNIGY